jgi:16S rRNA (cytosine967-C5)-methyltransferase
MQVLDLCAAPGNKTAQILAAGAAVIACDRYQKRLAEVPSSALRVVLDATEPLPFSKTLNRILVDAPCSGTGTLARNPEIKWRLRERDLAEFHNRQVQILANALRCLESGGSLVYATCSLEREENEDVVAEVLGANPSFKLASTHLRLPGRDPGDGFFAAVIQR